MSELLRPSGVSQDKDLELDIDTVLDLGDTLAVHQSMQETVRDLWGDEFTRLAKKYIKQGATLLPDQLSLVSSNVFRDLDYSFLAEERGKWEYDSPFAFILQHRSEPTETPMFLSVVGFTYGSHLENYMKSGKGKKIGAAVDSFPVINQIQGPQSHSTYKLKPEYYEKARGILGQVRWEPLLMATVHEWAKSNKLEKLGVLPAEYNLWVSGLPEDDEKFKRFKRRYDHTAKRYGFEKNEKSSFFELDINNRPSPLDELGK